jgi:hypothetical protein
MAIRVVNIVSTFDRFKILCWLLHEVRNVIYFVYNTIFGILVHELGQLLLDQAHFLNGVSILLQDWKSLLKLKELCIEDRWKIGQELALAFLQFLNNFRKTLRDNFDLWVF